MPRAAGHSSWRHVVARYLDRFQGDDLRVGQLALLWATAVLAVLAVCAAFFLTLFWVLS